MKKQRFLISLLMAIVMMAMSPQKVWAELSKDASGTYLITSAADLEEFATKVNGGETSANAKLTADITRLLNWTPIGNSSKKYTGTFDGQGYTIGILQVNLDIKTDYKGLFGYINGATIKNLKISGGTVSSSNNFVGTVVGRADGASIIQNIQSDADVYIKGTMKHIGGIVGELTGSSKVSGCVYTGTIDAGSSHDCIGGIVGFADGGSFNGSITYCFSNCTIKNTSTDSSLYMGGILGYLNDENSKRPTIRYNFSDSQYKNGTSDISGDYVNAIIGRIRKTAANVKDNHFIRTTNITRTFNTVNTDCTVDASNSGITISVTGGSNGTTSYSYVYPTTSSATQIEVVATPNKNYYCKWSDGGEPTHNVELTDNVNLSATFTANPTITVVSSNESWGNTTGSGQYAYNSEVTITATRKAGYKFLKWNDGNTDAVRTIIATEDKTYIAEFVKNMIPISVSVEKGQETYGTVSGTGEYQEHSYPTIKATPNPGYHFKQWQDGNTEASRKVFIVGRASYTASFEAHSFGDWITDTPATCTSTGTKHRECTHARCNEREDGTIPALGHDMTEHAYAAATCTTPGNEAYWTCSHDCCEGKLFKDVDGTAELSSIPTIAATGHSFGEWVTDVAATCTAEGTKHRVCTHAGCNEREDGTIAALEHLWGEDHTCTVCHHVVDVAHTGISGTCTWTLYKDGLMIVEPTEGETGTLEKWGDWVSAVPWNNYKDDIISVQFRGKVIAQRCEYMFYSCKNLRTIDFENFDTTNETSMYAMFSGCISLQSFNPSSFNTANVKNMASMFYGCSSLQSLDLSSFNTASVTNMNSMFYYCRSLQSLDLSNFNTSSVADMSYMFRGCSSLQSLDLSSFNTASVTNMNSMFPSCEELAVLKLSNDFVIETECQTTYMFYDCGKSVMNGKIYYVLNGTTQNKIKSSITACNYMDIVSSAIVKDGVPFKMSQSANVPGKDVVVTRQFAAQKPASVMLPFTVNDASQISGATFYEFKGVRYENNEWVATMQDVSTVAAYKPYVVIREGAGDITFGNGSQTVSFPVTPAASSMTTTDTETGWTFQALNESKRWEEGDEEIGKAYGFAGKNKDYDDYSVAQGDFVKIAAGASAKPGRCYLLKDGPLMAKGMNASAEELPATIKVRFIDNQNGTTGISGLNTETGEMSEVQWYDLNGQKIDKPTKRGIYIKNNKKVMVK